MPFCMPQIHFFGFYQDCMRLMKPRPPLERFSVLNNLRPYAEPSSGPEIEGNTTQEGKEKIYLHFFFFYNLYVHKNQNMHQHILEGGNAIQNETILITCLSRICKPRRSSHRIQWLAVGLILHKCRIKTANSSLSLGQRSGPPDSRPHISHLRRWKKKVSQDLPKQKKIHHIGKRCNECVWATCDGFLRPLLWKNLEVLQRYHNAFDVPKHRWEAEAEEHDEEEDRPQWGEWHLGDGLCEDDKRQTGSFNSLK